MYPGSRARKDENRRRDSQCLPRRRFLLYYRCFTDIEFNPAKSINTQVKAAAMLKLMAAEYGYLPSFTKEELIQYHREHVSC